MRESHGVWPHAEDEYVVLGRYADLEKIHQVRKYASLLPGACLYSVTLTFHSTDMHGISLQI